MGDKSMMTVLWGDYSAFDPGVSSPLHEVSKRQARAAFNRLMADKDERVAELRRLLQLNGIDLEPSDFGLQKLNDWFRAAVEGDPATGRLRSIWYGVVNDLALFLGDVMIQRCPTLHWTFYDKGAKDLSFQRHVIMGFSKVPNPKYNVDIDFLLGSYAHRIVANQEEERDAFVRWVRGAQEKA
ncbi:hypothetical protein ACIBL3_26980 [Kribbella sp. NPDC050124]|uniref:hypothetical protein n=1 Tax=Kribbella sp. NPDC050124 TaxID=3364114 RepID=UPI0037A956A9